MLNIRNPQLIDETCEDLVSNMPNQLLIFGTQKGCVLGIWNHLIFDETCEEFVLNVRNHLMGHGTLEDL